ncbi:MAG: polysaccharide biosynthesis tyrosine autokinase [Salibacteraceae bacterium]
MEFEPYLEQANRESKRFIQRSIVKTRKFWWLVAASTIIALIAAFLIIRYSPKIYSIGAKVMIQNTSEGLDASSLIFGDQLLGNNQDVVNELIIVKSYPILEQTVLEQGQNAHYFRTTTALERIIEIDPKDSPFWLSVEGDWIIEEGLGFDEPLYVEFDESEFTLHLGHDIPAVKAKWGEVFTIEEKTLRLDRNPEFETGETKVDYFFLLHSVEQTVQSYQERIKAELAQEKSSIVSLSLEGALVNREVRFMQSLLDNYLQANLDEKNTGASNTIHFINKELASIKDSLKKIEGRLEVFKSRNQISNLQTEGQRIFEKLLELEEEKAEFQLREKYLSLVDEYLQTEDGSKLVTPASFGIMDPSLNNLIDNLIRVETERNLMGENSESSITVQLTARINELRRTLNNYIENVASSNKIKLNEVSQRMALVERTIEDLPMSEIALMNIERLHKLSESLYLLLLEKKAEAEITKSSNTPDIKVVEAARKMSADPVRPNKKLIYGGFFLLGLALPMLWILLTVYLDNSIRSKEEITAALDTPFMGYIAAASDKPEHYVIEQPKSHLAETFRTLRSNLKYLGNGTGVQTILVSSCFPGEGKTFVSVNLALSVASAGKKVVLIGADLRKPQLQLSFGLDNGLGLSTVLTGKASLKDAVHSSTHGVDVITSGPIPPNPLELLDSQRFTDLLTELKGTYDYVVIDTSPFMLVSDAKVLFHKSDINLIVLRSGVSRRENLELIENTMAEHASCRFGLLLNDHDLSGEYGYHYGKGYAKGYYQE